NGCGDLLVCEIGAFNRYGTGIVVSVDAGNAGDLADFFLHGHFAVSAGHAFYGVVFRCHDECSLNWYVVFLNDLHDIPPSGIGQGVGDGILRLSLPLSSYRAENYVTYGEKWQP